MCLPICSKTTILSPESRPARTATGAPNSSSGKVSVSNPGIFLTRYSSPSSIDDLSGRVGAMHLTPRIKPLSEREVTIASSARSLPSTGSVSSLCAGDLEPSAGSSIAPPVYTKGGSGGSGSSAESTNKGASVAKETPDTMPALLAGDAGAGGSASVQSPPQPLMLTRDPLFPREDRFSLLESLNNRVKRKLLCFSDYEAIQAHAIELLRGKCRYSEEMQFLVNSALQFAEFQTLQERLPNTNEFENIEDTTGVRITVCLLMAMKDKSLDTTNEVTVYLWTLQKIIELNIPPTHYIQVYRNVTNYIRIRTNGRDWLPEEISVMQALSKVIASRRININETDDELVSSQTSAWLAEILAEKKIPLDLQDRISEKVHSYVMELKIGYQQRLAIKNLFVPSKKA